MVDPVKSRFFIAFMLPQAIQDYANTVIQELGDRYHTCTAKAPPHITLQPPFYWVLDQIPVVEQCLSTFAAQRSPVPITLSGFGAFAPRVLYIHVLKTPELLTLQADLRTTLDVTVSIVDPKTKQRPFSPHLTVASRNVTPAIFKQAWAEVQSRPVEFECVGDRLTLLLHNGQQWQVHSEFGLNLS